MSDNPVAAHREASRRTSGAISLLLACDMTNLMNLMSRKIVFDYHITKEDKAGGKGVDVYLIFIGQALGGVRTCLRAPGLCS
jgi:hypothetical protein